MRTLYLNPAEILSANLRYAADQLGIDTLPGFPLFSDALLTFYVLHAEDFGGCGELIPPPAAPCRRDAGQDVDKVGARETANGAGAVYLVGIPNLAFRADSLSGYYRRIQFLGEQTATEKWGTQKFVTGHSQVAEGRLAFGVSLEAASTTLGEVSYHDVTKKELSRTSSLLTVSERRNRRFQFRYPEDAKVRADARALSAEHAAELRAEFASTLQAHLLRGGHGRVFARGGGRGRLLRKFVEKLEQRLLDWAFLDRTSAPQEESSTSSNYSPAEGLAILRALLDDLDRADDFGYGAFARRANIAMPLHYQLLRVQFEVSAEQRMGTLLAAKPKAASQGPFENYVDHHNQAVTYPLLPGPFAVRIVRRHFYTGAGDDAAEHRIFVCPDPELTVDEHARAAALLQTHKEALFHDKRLAVRAVILPPVDFREYKVLLREHRWTEPVGRPAAAAGLGRPATAVDPVDVLHVPYLVETPDGREFPLRRMWSDGGEGHGHPIVHTFGSHQFIPAQVEWNPILNAAVPSVTQLQEQQDGFDHVAEPNAVLWMPFAAPAGCLATGPVRPRRVTMQSTSEGANAGVFFSWSGSREGVVLFAGATAAVLGMAVILLLTQVYFTYVQEAKLLAAAQGEEAAVTKGNAQATEHRTKCVKRARKKQKNGRSARQKPRLRIESVAADCDSCSQNAISSSSASSVTSRSVSLSSPVESAST